MPHLKSVFARVGHFPWYPLVFCAYPVLALLSVNFDQLKPAYAFRPLLAFLSCTLVLFLILKALLHDWHRAAFLSFLLALFFSSYGQVYAVVEHGLRIPNPGNYLLPVWIILFCLALWLSARSSIPFHKVTVYLNIFSLILLAFPIYQISYFLIAENIALPGQNSIIAERLHLTQDRPLPDVYYIILDSYGRSDLLREAYGYDNSGFIAALEGMGFYVAECSQSNYVRTEQSLASSLNMNYLPVISPVFTPEGTDRLPLWKLLKRNAVHQIFEQAGYRTVAYASGFSWSELEDSDIYLMPSVIGVQPTEFEALLLRTTLARVLQDFGIFNLNNVQAVRYRERTLFVLHSLEKMAQEPGPKFVFVHLIPPHPPFVFGPSGKNLDPDQFRDSNGNYSADGYADGYQLQVEFISNQIAQVVRTIIDKSSTPPVIVIQGDHAPWFQSKEKSFDILNAYYFPGHVDSLYATISPVNTFRLIFNQYFGSNFPLRVDSSYFSPIPHIYNFTLIPNACTDKMGER